MEKCGGWLNEYFGGAWLGKTESESRQRPEIIHFLVRVDNRSKVEMSAQKTNFEFLAIRLHWPDTPQKNKTCKELTSCEIRLLLPCFTHQINWYKIGWALTMPPWHHPKKQEQNLLFCQYSQHVVIKLHIYQWLKVFWEKLQYNFKKAI